MSFKPGSRIGQLGEDIASRYLLGKGYKIIERNYWRKWGEIDIVAFKDKIIHFVEVKAVTRENLENVTYEDFRPEENVHFRKVERLGRVIQSYLAQYKVEENGWQFDIAAVYLDPAVKKAKIVLHSNIIL